jgi:uncharacterized protein (DUF1697 family)
VRSAAEWLDIIKRNPFPAEAKQDPAHLLVLCLKTAPGSKAFTALQAAITGPERVLGHGRQAYFYYPAGVGRSKLTVSMIDKALGAGTARNWNTVMKLATLMES